VVVAFLIDVCFTAVAPGVVRSYLDSTGGWRKLILIAKGRVGGPFTPIDTSNPWCNSIVGISVSYIAHKFQGAKSTFAAHVARLDADGFVCVAVLFDCIEGLDFLVDFSCMLVSELPDRSRLS